MILLILCGFMVDDVAMEIIRSKRQVDPSKMIPWMELGAKYGKIAAETVVMPMAKEGMEMAFKNDS